LQSSLRLETLDIDTIRNGDGIMATEVSAKLRGDHFRNARQLDQLPAVYAPFKPAGQCIIEAAMEELGPTSRGRVAEEQLRLHSLVEFFKHNMNLNHIRVPRIDPRRKHQVGRKFFKPDIPPPLERICNEPPHVLNQVRSWNGHNAMPTDAASSGLRRLIQWCEEVLNALGIEMNFAIVIPYKPLDKFRNDALGSMPLVKERRDDDKSHLTASSRRPQF
jgi:hypothetical protein